MMSRQNNKEKQETNRQVTSNLSLHTCRLWLRSNTQILLPGVFCM